MLDRLISDVRIGSTITLGVVRGGRRVEVRVPIVRPTGTGRSGNQTPARVQPSKARMRLEKETRPLVTTAFTEGPADLSFDGRWLAYQQSDGAGRREIYISPFPDVSSKRMLVAPGTQPVWARDGRELFYIAGSEMLTSVPIRSSPELYVGTPMELFSTTPYFSATQGRSYDVRPDRPGFVFIKDAPGADRRPARQRGPGQSRGCPELD